jgi:C-terminal processing protease CtpA/Prc
MTGQTDQIVAMVAGHMRDRYVLVEPGARAAEAMTVRLDEGAYAGLDLRDLCTTLTADLRSLCPDRHLRVVFREEATPPWPGDGSHLRRDGPRARLRNHGVARVERLPGNVGYLDLRRIDEDDQAFAAIAAAMTLLAHTFALLLDLRANDGGAPGGVAYLCSFFFAEPTHVNDVYHREDDTTRQYWTHADLTAPRYLYRPVFVLTGPRTFSGAEEIAYNLQQLGRATIVGEPTLGGAHPVGHFWLAPQVSMLVPIERSINPISGTNWEAVGVRPDVAIPAEAAQADAYRRALRHVISELEGQESMAWLAREANHALAGLDVA